MSDPLTPERLAGLRQTAEAKRLDNGYTWCAPEVVLSLLAEIDRLSGQRDKLQAFKTWVHDWLDAHGVPKEFPDGPHTREGCRIGDRMAWLWDSMTAALGCTPDEFSLVVASERAAQERLRDATAEANRLRQRVAALEAGLKPFADEVATLTSRDSADGWDGLIDDCPLHLYTRCWHGDMGATVGDCRRAVALLAAGK